MEGTIHVLDFPDEILKNIILFLGHWDKHALRAVCRRFFNLVVNDVRSLVITRAWVDQIVKSRRALKNRELPSDERRERKEAVVTLYVSRHVNLRRLHFYQSGLCLIHRTLEWRSYFAENLAKKCPNLEELLVQGTSGLMLAVRYAQGYETFHESHCKIKSLIVDPYQGSTGFYAQLRKFADLSPDLIRLTFISQLNETNFSRNLRQACDMLLSFDERLKYFSTDFTGDFDFKVLVIENLHNLSGLTLCRSTEIVNNEPFNPSHLEMINFNNPNLHRLKIPVTIESIFNLKDFKNLTELSLVLSISLTMSLFKDVFGSIGSKLTLLSLTFARSEIPRIFVLNNEGLSAYGEHYDANLDFSLCKNLTIFSIQGTHNLSFNALLSRLGTNCRFLNEIYYARESGGHNNMNEIIEQLTKICPLIQLVTINGLEFKGKNGSLRYQRNHDNYGTNLCARLERRYFY